MMQRSKIKLNLEGKKQPSFTTTQWRFSTPIQEGGYKRSQNISSSIGNEEVTDLLSKCFALKERRKDGN